MLTTLKAMESWEEDGKLKGLVAVIKGRMDFEKTDGYIQFMKMVLERVPVEYGKQYPKWQEYLDEICRTADKLQDENTRFGGHDPEGFKAYCKSVSKIMNKEAKSLPVPYLDIKEGDDLMPFIKECLNDGNSKAFYYEPEENGKAVLMNDLMDLLSRLKFEKSMSREHDVSHYLLSSGHHEHVHDALNTLIGTAVYAINCSSTKERDCYSFDTQKIRNELNYVKCLIERAACLI